jgi:hypothetical protein
MEASNATQPRNSSQGMTRVSHSGVPPFHARRPFPSIPDLTTYLVAR